jgi:adenine-specific DNA-methyltransferase
MNDTTILAQLDPLGAPQLRRLLVEHLTRRKLGLTWEADLIERDATLNTGVEFARTAHQGSVGIHNPRHKWISAGGVDKKYP